MGATFTVRMSTPEADKLFLTLVRLSIVTGVSWNGLLMFRDQCFTVISDFI